MVEPIPCTPTIVISSTGCASVDPPGSRGQDGMRLARRLFGKMTMKLGALVQRKTRQGETLDHNAVLALAPHALKLDRDADRHL